MYRNAAAWLGCCSIGADDRRTAIHGGVYMDNNILLLLSSPRYWHCQITRHNCSGRALIRSRRRRRRTIYLEIEERIFIYKFSPEFLSYVTTIILSRLYMYVCVAMQSTGIQTTTVFFPSRGHQCRRCHPVPSVFGQPPQLILKPNTSGDVKEKNGKTFKKKKQIRRFRSDTRCTAIMCNNIGKSVKDNLVICVRNNNNII